MKSYRISFRMLIIIPWLLILCYSCQKKEIENKILKSKVSGYVQKGPFINGTSVQMFELNSSLDQTGNVFNTQIINNKGSFEINNVELASQFVEFSANGYYFNEVTGKISSSPLTLYALSDLTDISTVNINILTHLEKDRVKYLVGKGIGFSEAKDSAQKEILAIFDFHTANMAESEVLDISVNEEENAILLAISLILQGNRSAGELTELLANITSDIREDGELSQSTILTSLRNSTIIEFDSIPKIRINIEERYNELGIIATIPDFEKFINEFLEFTGSKPTTSTQEATNITTTGATLNGLVNANDLITDVTFEYGLTTEYGSTVTALQSPVSGHSLRLLTADISGLNPGTPYHFRIKAVNSLGTVYGVDSQFLTSGQRPTVMTEAASNLTLTGATLNGTVNANELNTTVLFEYGITTGYGSVVNANPYLVTSNSETTVSANLDDLSAGIQYHFRIKAENQLGITYGEDETFSILGGAPKATTHYSLWSQSGTLILYGLVNPNYFPTVVTFEYGATTSYGRKIQPVQNPFTGNEDILLKAEITSLSKDTVYHFRVVAENSLGKVYGQDLNTKYLIGLVDYDGNVYTTVKIGTQEWMAKNLMTTRFSDGTEIPLVTDDNLWSGTTNPAFCYYDNNEGYKDVYGPLYNWYTAKDVRLCPGGWRVPSQQDFYKLAQFLDANALFVYGTVSSFAGGLLKEADSDHWHSPNIGATNSTGFTARGSGYRAYSGGFEAFNDQADFWTTDTQDASHAWQYYLPYQSAAMQRNEAYFNFGFSVRCMRDLE